MTSPTMTHELLEGGTQASAALKKNLRFQHRCVDKAFDLSESYVIHNTSSNVGSCYLIITSDPSVIRLPRHELILLLSVREQGTL